MLGTKKERKDWGRKERNFFSKCLVFFFFFEKIRSVWFVKLMRN